MNAESKRILCFLREPKRNDMYKREQDTDVRPDLTRTNHAGLPVLGAPTPN